MGRGRELGGARAFQKHRVGESFDPGGVLACRGRHLFDRCTRADPGLNLLGGQHVRHLGIGLSWQGVTAQRGAEAVVRTKDELLGALGRLADDACARPTVVEVESDDLQFSHVRPPRAAQRSPYFVIAP